MSQVYRCIVVNVRVVMYCLTTELFIILSAVLAKLCPFFEACATTLPYFIVYDLVITNSSHGKLIGHRIVRKG